MSAFGGQRRLASAPRFLLDVSAHFARPSVHDVRIDSPCAFDADGPSLPVVSFVEDGGHFGDELDKRIAMPA
jgi:hypothetical protein